jgi:hypothetical protein
MSGLHVEHAVRTAALVAAYDDFTANLVNEGVLPRTKPADLAVFVGFVLRCYPRRPHLVDHTFLIRAARRAARSTN